MSSVVPEVKVKTNEFKNEPVLAYLKGSRERIELEKALAETAAQTHDVPIVIGDQEFRTKEVKYQVRSKTKRKRVVKKNAGLSLQVMPHNHKKKLAKFYYADDKLVKKAIDVAVEAQKSWDQTPIEDRLIVSN